MRLIIKCFKWRSFEIVLNNWIFSLLIEITVMTFIHKQQCVTNDYLLQLYRYPVF